MSFDPYYTWLGIPPRESAHGGPNYYRLLGLTPLETNPDAISNAADRQMSHIRTFQNGPHAADSQRLLSEISGARNCLLNFQTKAAYDAQLGGLLAAPVAIAAPPEPPPPVSDFATAPSAAAPHAQPVVSDADSPKRRAEKNPVIEVIKIAAGGLAGCAIAILLLRYVFLRDITGLLPLPKSDLPQQVAASAPGPAQSRPAPTTVSPSPAEAPIEQPGTDPTHRPADSSVDGSGTPSAATPEPAPPATGKKKGKKGKAAPAPGPAPATIPPAAPVLRDKRLPVPPNPEQEAAARQVEETFGLSGLKTADEKFRLADELLKASRGPGASPATQFVLLQKAAELAEQADDAQRMCQSIELLSQRFDVEPLLLEGDALVRFAAAAHSPEAIESLVLAARPVVQFAIREGQFDLARNLTEATLKACNQPHGLSHRKYVADGQKIVARQQKEWEAYQQALGKLSAMPDDPAANLVAGTWLVEARADWEAAWPHLSRCGRAPLKLAADLELARPANAEGALALAQAWHEAARSGGAGDVWLVRALYWYDRTNKEALAKPAAADLEKVLQELKTDEAAQRAAQELAHAVGRGQIHRRLPQAARRYCALLLTMEESSSLQWGQQRLLADASGQFNHGLVQGPVFVPGKAGAALSFDGQDDYVECADVPSLNPPQALTICAWVRPESWQKSNYLVSKDDWASGPHGYVLRLASGGPLDLTLGQGSGWATARTTSAVALSEWTHVAAVYDGQNQVLLINGVEQASQPLARPIAASSYPVRIGLGAFAKDRRFHGQIDEVALFGTALTAADIRAIYELGLAGEPLAR